MKSKILLLAPMLFIAPIAISSCSSAGPQIKIIIPKINIEEIKKAINPDGNITIEALDAWFNLNKDKTKDEILDLKWITGGSVSKETISSINFSHTSGTNKISFTLTASLEKIDNVYYKFQNNETTQIINHSFSSTLDF
ncbi:MAG: hypothetical protein ACRCRZ_02100 [Metamycoplasmataceae bacterium]